MKYVLYKATSPSGKTYIGVTNNFKRRLKEHGTSPYSFGCAIRKYGKDNFTYTFEQFETADAALNREAELVTLEALSSGSLYNETIGGSFSNTLIGDNPTFRKDVLESHPALFTTENNPMNDPIHKANASLYQTANKKAVSVDSVEYSGVREAAKSIGVSRQCLVYRLKSPSFPSYFYLKQDTAQGKSYAMLADPLRDMNNPNFSGLLVRHTTEELRELISKSQELYPKAIPGIVWSERKQQWTTPRGGRLWMSFLDRDLDVMRYQGQAFNWIGFDELTQWATPYALNYMGSRLRTSDPSLRLYMRCTSNPGGPGHAWVKKGFIDPAPFNTPFVATDFETGEQLKFPKGHSKEGQALYKRRFIPATLFDNPYLSADGQYEAMLLSLPEAQRKQLLEGSWDISDGAAFPEFNRKVHIIEPFSIPEDWVRFRAADYGYGSKSACLWIAVAPSEQLIVYRELYTTKVTAVDFADMVVEAEAGERIRYGVLDSSLWHKRGDTGPSLAEKMIMQGCRWRPSDRSKGSRVAGKNELHRLLQIDAYTEEPRIVFFNNCVNILSELPIIPLDRNNLEDVDTNSNDHGYDALRYGIMSRPRSNAFDWGTSQSISDFSPSDTVMGY